MKQNNWNGKPYHEVVLDFANFLDEIKEDYYRNKEIESEMNKKQQDILHDLEFGDYKYHEIAKLGKEIRDLRRNRREYKNAMLYDTPIKEFIKDKKKDFYITELRELAHELEENSKIVDNQYYNIRASIDNISTMKKDSKKEEDINSEDLIQLNRVLNKYCVSLESNISGIDEVNGSLLINAKMQLENQFGLHGGKKIISDIAKNIEKFYKPRGSSKMVCHSTSSDICLHDDYGKNTLLGNITIYNSSNLDIPLYILTITIREGKNVESKGKKKNKGGKKRKR